MNEIRQTAMPRGMLIHADFHVEGLAHQAYQQYLPRMFRRPAHGGFMVFRTARRHRTAPHRTAPHRTAPHARYILLLHQPSQNSFSPHRRQARLELLMLKQPQRYSFDHSPHLSILAPAQMFPTWEEGRPRLEGCLEVFKGTRTTSGTVFTGMPFMLHPGTRK